MAEVALIFLTPLIENAISKASSLAGERISLTWGLKKHLQELAGKLTLIQEVLQANEEKQESNKAVKNWLRQLSDVAYEAKDALDEYAYELLRRKVQSQGRRRKQVRIFFSRTAFHLKMGDKIRKINQSLVKIKDNEVYRLMQPSEQSPPTASARRNSETHSCPDSSKFVGRDDDVLNIVRVLDDMRSQHLLSGISIVGLGGIGKTALAKSICKIVKERQLYNQVAWVCVSENFDEPKILRSMLECLGSSASGMTNMDALVKELEKGLEGKKFLLVLDDVWNEITNMWNENVEKWNNFEACLLEISKTTKISILVTTRNKYVASIMEKRLPMPKHDMKELSNDECWLIIEDNVLRSPTATSIPSSLKHIGQQIASKCVGLPLVAKVIGGTLGRKISIDWWEQIRDDEAWISKNEDEKILSILKISFDRLPLALKKCFLYCSIFPKDYVIKIDDLVQLWMAHDFLHESHGTMEDLGYDYFQLLCNSLFQDIEFDLCGNIKSCKMHDIVHDLALRFSKGETFIWDGSCNSDKNSSCNSDKNSTIRHLRVEYDGGVLPTIPRKIAHRLHSLFAHVDVFCSMASNLKSLRSLKLFGEGRAKELPVSLNKLKHLRYLNALETSVKAPPQSFSSLYNLQILKVKNLPGDGAKLPRDGANLISLRHLYSYHPFYASTQQLTSLQTLSKFYVGTEKGYGIEELGCLNQLRGELEISRLNCVRSKFEASKANLKEKKLYKLKFAWDGVGEGNINHEEVIESLEPHSNLKSLTIEEYGGKNFPSWWVRSVSCSGSSFLLNNLVELNLSNCNECTSIPSLGLLPSLKVLSIVDLQQLRRMGHKFHVRSQSSGVESITLFPALKELSMIGMSRLEEWVEVDEDAAARGEVEAIFPCLEELYIEACLELKTWSMGGFSSNHKLSNLTIWCCPNLMAIPNIDGLSSLKNLDLCDCASLPTGLGSCISLQELSIEDMPNLISIPNIDGLSSLERLKLSGLKQLTSLPTGLGSCISLEEVSIRHMPNLISIPNIDGLSSLKKIYLDDCKELTSLPTGLGSCISLQGLDIHYMPNLISIPEDVGRLHSLTFMAIGDCEKLEIQEFLGCLTINLKELRVGPFCQDLEEFPLPRLNSIASVESLVLTGWDKLKSLPHQLQHLTTVKQLEISSFKGVEALPEWLENLSSLHWLQIWNCPNLTCLPSLEAMRRLSNLKYLFALDCPKLRERCANKSGPEWSKISHIPYIYIDGIEQGDPRPIF